MEASRKVTDLKPGDFVISIVSGHGVKGRPVNASFDSLKQLDPGAVLSGPRGGKYEVTAAGSDTLRVLVCGSQKPVVSTSSFVKILVLEEW